LKGARRGRESARLVFPRASAERGARLRRLAEGGEALRHIASCQSMFFKASRASAQKGDKMMSGRVKLTPFRGSHHRCEFLRLANNY
jgi:hypothetical protein